MHLLLNFSLYYSLLALVNYKALDKAVRMSLVYPANTSGVVFTE